MLLKVGRHIRPAPNFKIIVAREEGENRFLHGYRKQYAHLSLTSHAGPFALLDGDIDEAAVKLAARIVGRYSKGRDADQIALEFTDTDGNCRPITVTPLSSDDLPRDWLL